MRADLNMRRVAAKFVPKVLSTERKELRVQVAQDMLDSTSTDREFLNTVFVSEIEDDIERIPF